MVCIQRLLTDQIDATGIRVETYDSPHLSHSMEDIWGILTYNQEMAKHYWNHKHLVYQILTKNTMFSNKLLMLKLAKLLLEIDILLNTVV